VFGFHVEEVLGHIRRGEALVLELELVVNPVLVLLQVIFLSSKELVKFDQPAAVKGLAVL
jgi:hypothetical protein